MTLAVIVIGRNEGERLGRCLGSLAHAALPIVYVDSGSADSSVALARSHGAEVIELDPGKPFSAARARNEGFKRCKEVAPEVEFVMFVDGDCEIVSGWLARAERELRERPELAIVCGRRRELDPNRSVYNRLADLEWDTPVGLASACGGDALVRVADFIAVGMFNPTAKAGEEPELCLRLRQAGRKIARIDAEMTRHDLNMTRFGQWWRRQFRVGYHGLDIATRFAPVSVDGQPVEPALFADSLRRARIWGIGWPLVVGTAAIISGWLVGPWATLLCVASGLLILAAQVVRLACRVRPRFGNWNDALAFGGLSVAEKWANLAGQIRYLIDRRRGNEVSLIEYKSLTPTGPTYLAD